MSLGFEFGLCPVCGCNNAPMVWLGKQEGWICEDCLEKEVSEKNGETKDKENSKVNQVERSTL